MRNLFATSGDDSHVNRRRRLDDRAAEALLSGRAVDDEAGLSAFVAGAQAMVAATAPAPSPELAHLLEHGVAAGAVAPAAVLPRRRVSLSAVPHGRVGLALGSALVVAIAGVLGAAAANTLPARAQTAVADVVGWVTPLHLPRPGSPAVVPVGTPSPSPSDDGVHATSSPPVTEGTDDHGSVSGSGDSGSSSSDDGSSPRPSSGSDSGTASDGGSTSSGSGSDDTKATPTLSPGSSSGSGSGDSGSGGGGSDDTSPTPAPSQSDSSGSGGSSDDGH
jgi:hypothetical protein